MFMGAILFGLIAISVLLFIVPTRFKQHLSLAIVLLLAAGSSVPAVMAFLSTEPLHYPLMSTVFYSPVLVIDKLSAFFILIINFTMITGTIYSRGYLQSYLGTKGKMVLSVHFLSMALLHFAMLLLCSLRDGFSFLLAWELMTVSSFLLVMFDAEQRNILNTAIQYLIQMHIGLLFIVAGFLITAPVSGTMSFDNLPGYFAQNNNFPIFLLFFVGFGIKAGFVPFHTWLPEAHPAAPSHVSGIMSGVMIKMGIYGILRVTLGLHSELLTIGIFVLCISSITGLYGILQALLQRDLKKLLAYSSIENIGIMGLGIGTGIVGLHFQNHLVALLGFTGSLLHILNHSLFKSLLFFSAGSVYKAAHTRNMNELGGLSKTMPKTSILFLTGALAICGLPPFNGFVSEFLIYSGLFTGMHNPAPYVTTLFLGGIFVLALIGGLALFTFTKAYGITFLGESRSSKAKHATEVTKGMIGSKAAIAAMIVLVGLIPTLFVDPIMSVVLNVFPVQGVVSNIESYLSVLWQVGLLGGIFVVSSIVLIGIRKRILAKRSCTTGPTWGCGYTAPQPSLQYTAGSYPNDVAKIVRPIIKTHQAYETIEETEIFPEPRQYATYTSDKIKTKLTDLPAGFLWQILRRLAVLQDGLIQHYILYALLFMLLVFILSFSNVL
jgi:formate hydrogenlyase subunit 3/multisubunit Na+/H+ antiporter MnhD subunit